MPMMSLISEGEQFGSCSQENPCEKIHVHASSSALPAKLWFFRASESSLPSPFCGNSMHTLRTFLALAFVLGAAAFGRCAEAPAAAAGKTNEAAAEGGEHGLPQAAPVLRPGGLLTSSMVVTWVVAIGLIIFARVAMKNTKEIPDGKQNFWE